MTSIPISDAAKVSSALTHLANASLFLWDLESGSQATLLHLSENATFLVAQPTGPKCVLRIHRENYHTRHAISCELQWMAALAAGGGVITPTPIPGRDGGLIQTPPASLIPAGKLRPRNMVLFEFVDGKAPDESQDLVNSFEQLGELTAKAHAHALRWERPADFQRMSWNEKTIFGPSATWGDWRDAPGIDLVALEILERAETSIVRRLTSYGKSKERFELIHADMRLANLLIDNGSPRLIDFDDCGFGWFLYDFATGVSFLEDHPRLSDLTDAWLSGYLRIRQLDAADIAEIPTLIMLRRMAELAWLGSHPETDLARELGDCFAQISAELAKKYLASYS